MEPQSPFYGVPHGVFYGQHDRVDELNTRIHSRQFPDKPLAPNFDSRPVSTKNSRFAILDSRMETEPIQSHLDHSVEQNFNPSTYRGPPNTFLQNIDTESYLKNQTVALQHGAEQGVYVPSSQSDLYKVQIVSRPGANPHPDLFAPFSSGASRQASATPTTFHNHTRFQLRGG